MAAYASWFIRFRVNGVSADGSTFGLLGIARSSFYYRPRPEFAEELDLLKRLDRVFTNHPVYGSRRLQVALLREGISVGPGASGG